MLGILCYCLSSFQRHFKGERPVSFKFVVCVLMCSCFVYRFLILAPSFMGSGVKFVFKFCWLHRKSVNLPALVVM